MCQAGSVLGRGDRAGNKRQKPCHQEVCILVERGGTEQTVDSVADTDNHYREKCREGNDSERWSRIVAS